MAVDIDVLFCKFVRFYRFIQQLFDNNLNDPVGLITKHRARIFIFPKCSLILYEVVVFRDFL